MSRRPGVEPLEMRDVPSTVSANAVAAQNTSTIASIVWNGETTRTYAGQWIASFDSASAQQVETRLAPVGIHVVRPIGSGGLFLLQTPAGTSADDVERIVHAAGGTGVTPNVVASLASLPNDPEFGNQYALHNTGQTIAGQAGVADADVDAPEAWDVTRGSSSVVVAVLDTGIDLDHVDLADNVFVNPGEIANNGIDDDGNGFVDDVHGWDFHNDDNSPDDDNLHGTHVSGIVAAIADNGVGVAGVAPRVKVLPLKIFDASGNGSLASILAAIDYVEELCDRGIDVVAINASWGFSTFNAQFRNAISGLASRDVLCVASAGNSGTNIDSAPFYPASFTSNNVIAVAASDNQDHKASDTNYGATSVDIAAPGVSIVSTLPGDSYGSISGTSMSTALVSGAAALLRSAAPNATYSQIRSAIFAGGDAIADFATGGPTPISTGKRLNVNGAMQQIQTTVVPTITGVAPFVGPLSGGNAVVITGTCFAFATNAFFGGIAATSINIDSATQITAFAPSRSAGTVNVTVANAAGTSATAGTADDYTYAQPSLVSVVVNGGDVVARNRMAGTPTLAGQSSVVGQILVTFNVRVSLDADAFAVTALASSVSASGVAPSSANVAVTATGVPATGSPATGYSQYVLTFQPGDSVNSFDNGVSPALGNAFTTLKNGLFRLDATGSKIHAGVSDTASDRSDVFWSLYGAVNAGDVHVTTPLADGNDTLLVDGLALNDIYSAFGARADTPGPPTYRDAFDWNLDGFVDGVDLTHLYGNFGTVWKF